MIKLVLADDRALLRDGLRRILTDAGVVSVIAETSTADLLSLPAELDPHVVLISVDQDWPRIISLIPAVVRERKAAVLLLATTPRAVYVKRALRAGAAGMIATSASSQDLIEAVIRAARGDRITDVDGRAGWRQEGRDRPLPELSEREFEVMRMLGSGWTVRQIASTLELSPKTVSTYRGRIMDKLGLHGTAELVRFVLERGLAD